jgi:glutathione peroxidase
MTTTETSLYDIPLKTLSGEPTSLRAFEGQVLLVVNVASHCGFTPQYAGLEALYQKYKARGFSVLGFPCNQFGAQEPGTAEEIESFCSSKYNVSFPLFEKVEVNGQKAHPLFAELKASAPGILGTEGIKWNFTKFLLDRSGKFVERFAPQTTPEAIDEHIARLL